MTIFVTFALGAKEAYFFNSPTHWAWHNLPPDVESLFTNQPRIKDVLELALGGNGAYFISYRNPDGQILCRHYNLPNPLITYLYNSHPQVVRDLSTLSIALGPYDSYYAHDKNSASWSNLPPTLEKAVLNRLDFQDDQRTIWKEGGRQAPSFVSLGADGSYFMKTVAGGGGWDLTGKERYDGVRGINKFLEDAPDFTQVAALYLFPTEPSSYVLLLASGKAFSNLPEHTWTDYNKMAPHLPATVQTQMPIPPVPQPRFSPPNPPPFQYTAPPIRHSHSISQPRFQYDPNIRPHSNGSYQGNYVTPPLQPQTTGYHPPTHPQSPHIQTAVPANYGLHRPLSFTPPLPPTYTQSQGQAVQQQNGTPPGRYYNGQPLYFDGFQWRVQSPPAQVIQPQSTGVIQIPPLPPRPQPQTPQGTYVLQQGLAPQLIRVNNPQVQVQQAQQTPQLPSQSHHEPQNQQAGYIQQQSLQPQTTGVKKPQSNNYTKTDEG